MNIDRAVSLVVERVRKTGESQSRSVDALWSKIGGALSPSSIATLAKEGLRARAGDVLTNGMAIRFADQFTDAKPTDVVRLTQPPARTSSAPIVVRVTILDQVTYTTSTGKSKTVSRFTQDDFVYLIKRDREQVQGLNTRVRAFELGIELLKKHRVSRICDLPAAAKEQYAKHWSAVVRKKAASVAA